MFEHEAERFRETENGVGRFALRVGEMEDREIGAVNVVVTVNEEQLHALILTAENAECAEERKSQKI
jgi:hypothetical protein